MADVFRTPDERFEGLPGYDFAPHWHEVGGLRLHYVDEGAGDPVVCFHGEPTWGRIAARRSRSRSCASRRHSPDGRAPGGGCRALGLVRLSATGQCATGTCSSAAICCAPLRAASACAS